MCRVRGVAIALRGERDLHHVKEPPPRMAGCSPGRISSLKATSPIRTDCAGEGRAASGERIPPIVRPVLSDRILITIPRSRKSAMRRLRLPSSRYAGRWCGPAWPAPHSRRSEGSGSRTSGTMPPTHSPRCVWRRRSCQGCARWRPQARTGQMTTAHSASAASKSWY